MLLVKTIVKDSTIPEAGLGLFADEFIAKGTVVWRVTSSDDIIPDSSVAEYDVTKKEQFVLHAFQSNLTGNWISCKDGAQYVNHSEAPNLAQVMLDGDIEYADIASRDIQKGEELFDNYFDYDLDAGRKLAG